MYLIHGYLGYNNYGDELLASLVEREIRKAHRKTGKTVNIQRLSSKNSLLEHIRLISKCDEMICIGGLFQDKTGWRTPVYYFLTISFARLLDKSVKLMAQGIGPLDHWLSRTLALFACKFVNGVSVRDKSSHMLLKEWGVDHYYGSDLAWLLSDDKSFRPGGAGSQKDYTVAETDSNSRINNLLTHLNEKASNEKLLVVSLKSEPRQNDKGLVEKIAKEFSVTKDMPLVILQMQDEDSHIHNLFYRHTDNIVSIEAKYYDPEEIIFVLKNYCRLMIGMRLHALILAKIAGLEIIAIDSDPKIREFTHQVDVYNQETLQERAEKHYEKVLFLNV